MSSPIEDGNALRWLLDESMRSAPPPPRAAELLERSRPWWEEKAQEFRDVVEQLRRMQATYGHASPTRGRSREGHPVACLIVRGKQETECVVRAIYFSVRHGRLRFRFRFEGASAVDDAALELTFVVGEPRPQVFAAMAVRSVDNEYSLDVSLPSELTGPWSLIKVAEAMPFRLVARSDRESI